MRRILKRYKSTLSILGIPLPKTKYKPLKRKLQNATKPPKDLLRLRTYCVQEGIAFKKVLRLRAY